MTSIKQAMLLISLFLTSFTLIAQDNIRTYNFEAGKVLDILLLNQNPKSDSIAKIYFKTAIPIAIKNGYQPSKGFSVKDHPLQGNYHPQNMVIASWPSEEVRVSCLKELEEKVPQFHDMRRAIWTNFNVSYYPLIAPLSFQVNLDRYNVATAYWEKEEADMSSYIQELKEKIKASGGEMIVNLQQGKSTFGYKYQPDYLLFTSWKSPQQFKKFKKANLLMDHSEVEQVHQFRIQ